MAATRTTLVVALLVLVAFEVGLRVVEDRIPPALDWENQFTRDKAARITELGDLDVVVVGSSVANASIDVTGLVGGGEVGYNAALPAYSPRVWAAWYEDLVRPTRPEVVVVVVDIRQYNDNKPGAASQLERYLASDGRRALVEGVGPSWVDRLEASFAVTRSRPRLREPDKVIAVVFGRGDPGDWAPANLDPWGRYLGFARGEFRERPQVLADLPGGAFRDFEVGGVEEEALRAIVAAAVDDGAEVLLVITPTMQDRLEGTLPNGAADFAAFEASVRRVAAEAGVEVLDAPDMVGDERWFSDYYHLNDAGTQELTGRIAEVLGD
jgi:hypothetical protein